MGRLGGRGSFVLVVFAAQSADRPQPRISALRLFKFIIFVKPKSSCTQCYEQQGNNNPPSRGEWPPTNLAWRYYIVQAIEWIGLHGYFLTNCSSSGLAALNDIKLRPDLVKRFRRVLNACSAFFAKRSLKLLSISGSAKSWPLALIFLKSYPNSFLIISKIQ